MMVSIGGSVGQGGSNRPDDVMVVQQLLNANGENLIVDGVVGRKTIGAIRRFQSKFLRNTDGRVDPHGRTLAELSKGVAETLKTAKAIAPEDTTDWSGDSSQWLQGKKLLSLTPALRPKVSNVITALEKRDFQPKIFFGWRSVAVQLELFKKGHSKVKFSFHNAQLLDGTPNSYAADIIDKRWAWGPAAAANGFWKALGEEAKTEGLYWGGDWIRFRDWAHVQLLPNTELARIRKESGQ